MVMMELTVATTWFGPTAMAGSGGLSCTGPGKVCSTSDGVVVVLLVAADAWALFAGAVVFGRSDICTTRTELIRSKLRPVACTAWMAPAAGTSDSAWCARMGSGRRKMREMAVSTTARLQELGTEDSHRVELYGLELLARWWFASLRRQTT